MLGKGWPAFPSCHPKWQWTFCPTPGGRLADLPGHVASATQGRTRVIASLHSETVVCLSWRGIDSSWLVKIRHWKNRAEFKARNATSSLDEIQIKSSACQML